MSDETQSAEQLMLLQVEATYADLAYSRAEAEERVKATFGIERIIRGDEDPELAV